MNNHPPTKSPSWLAGYAAVKSSYKPTTFQQIVIPPEHKLAASDFISGWLLGARDARDEELVSELFA